MCYIFFRILILFEQLYFPFHQIHIVLNFLFLFVYLSNGYIYSIIERLFSKEKEELKLAQNYIQLKEKYDSLIKEKAILIKENDNRTNKKLLTEKLDS